MMINKRLIKENGGDKAVHRNAGTASMGSAPLQYLSHILHFQCSLASGKRKCRNISLILSIGVFAGVIAARRLFLRLEAAYSHRSSEYVKKKLRHVLRIILLKVGREV